jgi:hypothetical protein
MMNTKNQKHPFLKALICIFILLGSLQVSYAQAPNAIPYQGVARDATGAILPSQLIGLRYSIHDGTAGGPVVFSETFSTTTTSLGLFNINIGTGTPVTGTLGAVNWGAGAKYVQVELDPTGGTAYIDMGTTQLMSVPYALFAANAGGGGGGGWTVTPTTVYNDTSRIGIGVSNLLEKFVVGDTGLFRMLIGHAGNFNEEESGRLVFSEDVLFNGTCGFEFHHNGASNTLELVSGCTTLGDTSIVFTRTGEVRIPERVKIGENSNPAVDVHIKQAGTGTSPGSSGLRLENSTTSDNNQLWTDGTNLNFALNGTRIGFIDNVGAYNQVSDRRMKSNIVNMSPVLAAVMALNPVKYNYIYNGARDQDVFGFVAQDVQKLFPNMVGKSPGSDILALPYAEFSVIAIKAIQEQQLIINDQAAKMDKMEARLNAMEDMLRSLGGK